MSAANDESSREAATSNAGLEVERLRREVAHLNECLRRKNLALDALHWVWCDGGCEGGVHRYAPDSLTPEMVEMAERNTKRLRHWLNNNSFKRRWSKMSSDERNAWMAESTATSNEKLSGGGAVRLNGS